MTKAAINRVARGQLKIHGKKTITLWCSRFQIREYLKNHNWHCFEWNGKKFRAGEPWMSIILN